MVKRVHLDRTAKWVLQDLRALQGLKASQGYKVSWARRALREILDLRAREVYKAQREYLEYRVAQELVDRLVHRVLLARKATSGAPVLKDYLEQTLKGLQSSNFAQTLVTRHTVTSSKMVFASAASSTAFTLPTVKRLLPNFLPARTLRRHRKLAHSS